MTPEAPSVHKLVQEVTIRRATTGELEAAHDAAWELAKSSPAAAHWSRAAFRPYLATESGSGALQAKVLFLAVVEPAENMIAAPSAGSTIATVANVVGFAAFSAIMTIGAGEATLENMAVSQSWQQKGIGRRLLTAGLLWCRAHGAGKLFLEVRASNRKAIALYKHFGFSESGSRPGYYRDPVEDGLQMQKSLEPTGHAG